MELYCVWTLGILSPERQQLPYLNHIGCRDAFVDVPTRSPTNAWRATRWPRGAMARTRSCMPRAIEHADTPPCARRDARGTRASRACGSLSRIATIRLGGATARNGKYLVAAWHQPGHLIDGFARSSIARVGEQPFGELQPGGKRRWPAIRSKHASVSWCYACSR